MQRRRNESFFEHSGRDSFLERGRIRDSGQNRVIRSYQLTQDFGKGFTPSNLRNIRQFYLTFPNRYALSSNLTWTHYRNQW
ncbi:MAG: hypothetical protein IKS18_04930 [Lachnospiraceae bacterium]|nr:hypothetical protein [Lachnospiraceae bacterium]